MKEKKKRKFSIKDREKSVLIGLVEYFIKTNKPVGSHSLQAQGFNYLSSATIRNYFNKLEQEGYLKQAHSSSGRIPTHLAFREYVNYAIEKPTLSSKENEFLLKRLKKETKEIIDYINSSAEVLSEMTQCSCCYTLPLFDQDFINNIKMLQLDSNKLLCILITDFGFIRTETIYSPKALTQQDCQNIEDFFLWKLDKRKKPYFNDKNIYRLAHHFYNEIIVRHIVGYKNLTSQDINKIGLAKLFSYPEFNIPSVFASSLALFEDTDKLKSLLFESIKINRLTCWIGKELSSFSRDTDLCSFIVIPYYINQNPIGAFALFGPMRMNYRRIFAILIAASNYISETLTKSVSKYQLSFRQNDIAIGNLLPSNRSILLEDKTKRHQILGEI